MNELENSEFAKALEEAAKKFLEFDALCDRLREIKTPQGETICDAVGVKCDASCNIYLRKEKWLDVCTRLMKAQAFHEPLPVTPPEPQPQSTPDEPKERLCPSCGAKAPLPESKYCHVCGEEL